MNLVATANRSFSGGSKKEGEKSWRKIPQKEFYFIRKERH